MPHDGLQVTDRHSRIGQPLPETPPEIWALTDFVAFTSTPDLADGPDHPPHGFGSV